MCGATAGPRIRFARASKVGSHRTRLLQNVSSSLTVRSYSVRHLDLCQQKYAIGILCVVNLEPNSPAFGVFWCAFDGVEHLPRQPAVESRVYRLLTKGETGPEEAFGRCQVDHRAFLLFEPKTPSPLLAGEPPVESQRVKPSAELRDEPIPKLSGRTVSISEDYRPIRER